MTEAIAQDPVFAEMAKEMQEAMLSGDMGNLGLSSEDAGDAQGRAAAAPGMPPMPGMPGINPAKYMEAMQRVMQNTEFMAAAESLGRGLMSQSMDPQSLAMLELFQNPANQEALRKRLEDLKEDPELSEVLKDIEENGQSALMKYMNEPEIMAKVGRRFQEALDDPEFRAQLEGGNAIKGGEEEEEDEDTIISVAAAGDVEALKKLLSEGAAVDEKDDEDRTALHFTAGYDEIECMKVLLEAGAKIDALDSSKNTPLHFAAGYGNIEATRLLLEK